MAFRTNTAKAQEAGIKPAGEYEVIIDGWARKTTKNGAQSIGFTYVIRNDIEQPFKNGLIFYDIWKKHEPTPDDTMAEGYNYNQLMAVAEAANLPKEADYDTFDAFLNALIGKPIKVRLYHEPYNGKEYEKVDKHYKTAFPEVKHIPKEKSSPSSGGYAAPAQTTYANPAPSGTTSGANPPIVSNYNTPTDGGDGYPF